MPLFDINEYQIPTEENTKVGHVTKLLSSLNYILDSPSDSNQVLQNPSFELSNLYDDFTFA